jgi:ActR/RegA family two-component response regulator
VLIAEDDALFGRFLQEYLTRHGYRCTRVFNSQEATEALRQAEFDLLVADVHMPGNVGLELVQEVTGIAKGLPVVLITGHPSVETAAKSVRLAVAAYLLKPPDLDELCAVVRQTVSNYRHVRSVVATRQRLQDWNLDLERIEFLLRHAPADPNPSSLSSWMSITLKNLLLSMVEVKHLAGSVAAQPGSDQALQQAELLSALNKTVLVLEHTRRHFKSKELGELRKELEGVLRQYPKGSPAPPVPTPSPAPQG